MNITDAIMSPLEMAQQLAGYASSVANSSLPEYTASTSLRPMVLIDKRVLAVDDQLVTALLQTLLSIYAGMYLTGVNMAMTIGDVKVMRILDQFSTDRSILQAAGNSTWNPRLEAIDDTAVCLPRWGLEGVQTSKTTQTQETPSRTVNTSETTYEADGTLHGHRNSSSTTPGSMVTTTTTRVDTTVDKPNYAKAPDNENILHIISDESNLAVGKLIDVKLVHGEQSITMPIAIILDPKTIEPDDYLSIARANSVDKTLWGRYHAWRSGEIRFFKDYLLCLDLIEADKKALLADKTGTLLATRSKRTKGILAALLSGYASPNAVSTMVIISKQTASDLELTIRGSLKNPHVRHEFFSSNSTMMLVVVDTRMERFTFYQRGIADYRELTLADIKGNAKKPNGVDVNEILKAYQLGNAAHV